MSYAFKCDRCGSFYTHTHFDGNVVVNGENVLTRTRTEYDLCPDCFDYLMKYLNALKEPAVKKEEK